MTSLPFAASLWLALVWPLVLALRVPVRAVLAGPGRPRRLLDGLWCTAPLPALALAQLAPSGQLLQEWWMLGGVWELDGLRRPLLAFTALLWGLAGCYARGYLAREQARLDAGIDRAGSRLRRFALFWPLTLAGNLLLIVAEDIASFYLGFALMTFAAYGLVVNAGTRDARLGGLAYLVIAVLGEAMLLAGLLWAAGSAGSLTLGGLREAVAGAEQGVWMALLLWLGFGVKAGVVGLHLWLPLAHPVAPTPASAVLSGAMIKAGLLGWLGTLPLGEPGVGGDFRLLGLAMLVTGLVAALGAALYGACQRHPKAVLAYSSVSQMGMITALVAMGLVAPGAWPALSAAVVLFAAHHGLTKGALFLGVGVGEHPPRLPAWLLGGLLLLPALSLAGALGSGLATKWAFKTVLYDSGHQGVVVWLSLAAVGTTGLMARALWRQWQGEVQARHDGLMPLAGPMPLAWLGTLLAAVTLPWWLPTGRPEWPPAGELPGLLWPVALGAGLALVVLAGARRWPRHVAWQLPPGDLWWPLAAAWRYLLARARGPLARCGEWRSTLVESLVARERRAIDRLAAVARGEGWLRRHTAVVMMVTAIVLAMTILGLG
ncbi:complex I subunit 5 family protein [Halomonas sp. C05BenzN]|uniref:complex I subunit 5 family protein n=1 Tax=Halomonas sp. C05BenzN TaxID=3411041 RepID=UPI003B93A0F3